MFGTDNRRTSTRLCVVLAALARLESSVFVGCLFVAAFSMYHLSFVCVALRLHVMGKS